MISMNIVDAHQTSRLSDANKNVIVTDEINARLAFLTFQDFEKSKSHEETFDQKLERVIKQLSLLKTIIDQKLLKAGDKGEIEKNKSFLSQIELMQSKANEIVKNESSDKKELDESLKPIIKALSKLTSENSDKEATDNVTYELVYNKESKNILIAAKISELKKRLDIIQS